MSDCRIALLGNEGCGLVRLRRPALEVGILFVSRIPVRLSILQRGLELTMRF